MKLEVVGVWSQFFLEHLYALVAGELSALTGLQNMFGVGAGSILLPPVQTSALGMPLLQGPDGAINLINNIQVGDCSVDWVIKAQDSADITHSLYTINF